MKDLKNNNKKGTTKPTSGVPATSWARVWSRSAAVHPPGLAIKRKMAPSPTCHLVAFPEPVAAALFRPGLNVPPAPRGPRSWSTLTRPPGRRGHPAGGRGGAAPSTSGPNSTESPGICHPRGIAWGP